MKRVTMFLLLFISASLSAQLVNWTPVYFTPEDSVEIIFNAAEGNQGLMGYTGDVYVHAGLITSLSESEPGNPGAWRYVQSDWGENIDKLKLERIGTDLYKFVVSPSILEFYVTSMGNSLEPDEEITHLSFVFRSADATLQGKTADGGDVFVALYQGVNVVTPTNYHNFVNLNETIDVFVASSEATESLKLYINDELTYSVDNDTLEYQISVDQAAKNYVKIEALDANGVFSADSFYYIVNKDVTVADPPAGTKMGINYVSDTEAILALVAPNKENVYVIGEFNNWEGDYNYYMNKSTDGDMWWVDITGLTPAEEYAYQYLVDGELKIADPMAELVLDPWNDKYIDEETYPNMKPYPEEFAEGIVSVLQPGKPQYNWQVTDFVKPAKTDMVVYECLVRDFLAEHNYQTLIDTLDYLKNLGVNVLELMPVMEFEGNLSWGYNPAFMLAVDKYYGTQDDLKMLVDACHQKGIAVVLDIVLNHQFGNSPLVKLYSSGGNPTSDNPWFNVTAKHDFNVGYDMNHESQYTKDFVDRVTSYWIEEYNVDGYRFDLSKGFTQTNTLGNTGAWGNYDQSRINILTRMANEIWTVDPSAYVILEHFADNSEELVLSNNGMMLWGNMNHEYLEAAMGYSSNLSGTWYLNSGWSAPNKVSYMESHDEERMMFKNLAYGNSSGDYDVKDVGTALNRVKLASVFFFAFPGPKMIWQFGELGFDLSINWPSGTNDDRTSSKPPKWEYLDEFGRTNIYRVMSEMIKLRKEHEAFRNPSSLTMAVAGFKKRINLVHSDMSITVLGNFDVTEGDVTPNFPQAGKWYEYFTGDSIMVTNILDPITLAPGEFRVYTTNKLESPEDGSLLEVDDETLAEITKYELAQNYPNPFNPVTTIRFSLPESAGVTLKIYNTLGQEIKTLVNSDMSAGTYNLKWDGTDNSGSKVSTGVYIYKIAAGEFNETRKMVLLK